MEVISKDVSNINLCVIISEANMTEGNPKEWWYDTGATLHIYCDKKSFAELTSINNGGKLYMRNPIISKIMGHCMVILKMISRK